MKLSLKKITVVFFSALFLNFAYSQNQSAQAANWENDTTDLSNRSQLANASRDYPVTAGDIYQLSYAAGSNPVTYTIPVDSSYTIKVANLGVINGSGKTFMQLKKQVEDIVNRNYPMGGVQFYIVNPSNFTVVVKGEVKSTQIKSTWALKRVSSVLDDSLTDFASRRFVTIISKSGKKTTYDLYKASRDGDLSQNPYLRPEDTVIISRIERKVSISGDVERPGTYEILTKENLKELVEKYGGGLRTTADTSRMSLIRTVDSDNPAGNVIYLDDSAISSNYTLKNNDQIVIHGYEELRPSIVVEGIIKNPEFSEVKAETSVEENKTTAYRKMYRFYQGENYANFVRRIADDFTNYSDLESAYFIRNDNKINIDISKMLADRDVVSEYFLQKNDKLVIPYARDYENKILFKGEVKAVTEHVAWPLRRLSEHVEDVRTEYTSIRDILVTDPEGNSTVYDLYKASIDGDLTQNPYIQAGYTITLNRLNRKVTISGDVERPGTYQLLDGENLKNLVEYYARGLIYKSDVSRMTLTRFIESDAPAGNVIYLEEDAIEKNYELKNLDQVTIHGIDELRPSIIVEGIIKDPGVSRSDAAEDVNENKTASYKKYVRYRDGENYASFIRRIADDFTDYSDLENAYVIRGENKINLDLTLMLTERDYVSEYFLEKGDRLIIPYTRSFANKILIKGEVKSVVEVNAWPLQRLSSLISDVRTEYASSRNITVTDPEGNSKSYDLYKASRGGDMSQNPYIQAGNTITLNRRYRRVTIDGAVERPGTYEILDDENLKVLIEKYGNGLEHRADKSRVELFRRYDAVGLSGKKIYLPESVFDDDYELLDYDTILIKDYDDLTQIAYLEGAVQNNNNNNNNNNNLETSNRFAINFNEGENYAFFIRRNRNLFLDSSDLKNAYIRRHDEIIPINLEEILYDKDYKSELFVESYDTVLIPFEQLFVSVSGAVKNPGRYPYIPDRTCDYYIGLAGGFDRNQNTNGAVKIYDKNYVRYSKKNFITPESTIQAETTSFTFFFSKYAPIITTSLSAVTTVLSILAVTGVFAK